MHETLVELQKRIEGHRPVLKVPLINFGGQPTPYVESCSCGYRIASFLARDTEKAFAEHVARIAIGLDY